MHDHDLSITSWSATIRSPRPLRYSNVTLKSNTNNAEGQIFGIFSIVQVFSGNPLDIGSSLSFFEVLSFQFSYDNIFFILPAT